ncbi:MAG TPA: PilC/PilY family type IV pilus protein [Polyangiales bacterium]|nr:PilC/PilY family type IV pilus protein [Polyangiales bacterium]
MMLMVDTSGSMERKPDTTSCVDCLPACNNSTSDERNRWAITLEALTGTFSDYKCSRRERSTYVGQYDVSYFLPHFEFTTTAPAFLLPATQAQDGVLDSYRARLKFGLMTFDGVSTTVNGATLVPYANYSSVKTNILGQPGQYSYPDAQAVPNTAGNTPISGYGWKPLSFPGCLDYYGVNAGARGKGSTAGSLISVGLADDQTSVTSVNDSIQTALLQVRPYAGTPIAAMLDDLRYYLANDTDINSNDPFYDCRERYAILLTDGAPDAMFRGGSFRCDATDAASVATCATYNGVKACQCPYDTEVSLAGKLIGNDKLAALWVVAFNVNDTVALAALDNIAVAAGTSSAYRANNVTQLRSNLDSILSKTSPNSTSRSVPVVINTGRAIQLAGGKQFQISAGFKVAATSDTPWEGKLWRQRIECNNGAAEPQELKYEKGDIFHDTLNAQSATSRTIYTVKPGLLNTRGTVLNRSPTSFITNKTNVLKPDGSNFGLLTEVELAKDALQETVDTVSTTPVSFDATMPVGYFDLTAATRDNIVSFVRGTNGTYRATHKLGDIYHSNPAVIPPIFPGSDLLSTFDPQLRGFYLNLIDGTKTGGYWGHYDGASGRPGVVFVATNDGLLHAFNLDDWKNKSGNTIAGGTELWAMLPPAAFSMMKAVATPTHQFVFDGTPVVKDMIMSRDSSGANNLSTVLLIGLRGMPAYLALDVTWPDEPKFLWQRSFKYLGDTTGTPQLANVRLKWNGVDQIRAVAILPGGEGSTTGAQCAVDAYSRGKAPNTGARDNVRCWGLRGRSLYVVDVETGELVQEFDGRHFPSAVNGSVSVDGEELAVSRAAYFTDADGVLYRLSMNNVDPAKWRVMPIWDLYGGKATDFGGNLVSATSPDFKMGRNATFPPVLSRDPTSGNLTIVVGTGDVDNLTDLTANRVVSINEVRSYDSVSGELLASVAPVQNWALQLDAGESVTGPMAVLNDTLYFTSFTGPGSSGNKCTMGASRIVGGNVRNKVAGSGLPVPGLSPSSGTGAYVLQYKPADDDGKSLLLGLSITRDPVCFQGSATNDPINASLGGRMGGSTPGGGAFQLRSLVAGSGGTALAGSATADKGQKMFTRTLQIPTKARSVGWASSVE